MILNGVDPSSICLFTFTNKAANEMKERIKATVGDIADRITCGTYHSIANRLLRKYAQYIGYNRNFTIMTPDDCKKILKRIGNDYNVDPDLLALYISANKDKVILPQQALLSAINDNDKILARAYEKYQEELKRQMAMDFDDLIINTILLLENNNDIKSIINKKWRYISTDESQDSSIRDLRFIKLLAGSTENVCFILDDNQCLIEGTKIKILDGEKSIENITKEDKILVAAGKGTTAYANPESISKRKVNEEVYVIKTKTGKTITGTKNHIAFSKIKPIVNNYYVYLMYKHNYGFRIGRTSSVRSSKNREMRNGFEVRLNQENGDKIWIIHKCNSLQESIEMEQYYSYKYGIPQYVFKNDNHSQGLSQERIKSLYNRIDTIDRGKKLLKDLNLFFEYPFYTAQMRMGNFTDRKKLTFTMFGTTTKKNKKSLHKTQTSTQNKEYANYISKMTNSKTYVSIKNDKEYYINAIANTNYDEQWRHLVEIEQKMRETNQNFDLVLDAKLTKETNIKYNFTPFSHLLVGSFICIEQNNEIIEDEIIEITKTIYNGYVYDINVPYYRNYIANGIVTHNCIYGFRGANIEAVMNIRNIYHDMKIYNLSRNYRCSQTIVEASKSLIAKNKPLIEKKIRAARDYKGSPIIVSRVKSPKEEAARVVQYVQMLRKKGLQYKDIAILYRMSSSSRIIEQAFNTVKIKCKIVGGTPFFNRAEIQDVLSYLKLLMNEYDFTAFKRAITVPKRGIGDKTIEKIDEFIREYPGGPISIRKALDNIQECDISKANINKLKEFNKILNQLEIDMTELSPKEFINKLLIKIDIVKYLKNHPDYKKNWEERIENINELLNIASEYTDIQELLMQASLYTSDDEDINDEKNDAVNLLTMHCSKGTEYKAVIIVDCNEGTSPHYKAIGNEKALEEERRLFYVAMTRAKDYLFILFPDCMMLQGQLKYAKPSRFINEIDSQYIYRN